MKKSIEYFETIDPNKQIMDSLFENSFHTLPHSTYQIEQYLIALVRQGNIELFDEMLEKYASPDKFLAMGNLSKNPIRQMQYFTVACITLISRAAIDCGLDEGSSYEMSDRIIQKADTLHSPEAIAQILIEGIRTYIKAIHDITEGNFKNAYIRQAILYIEEHLQEKISLDALAKELELNKCYLAKLFKSETGKTVSDYIFYKKIELAKVLLLEQKYTQNEIGEFLGFSSQSYFIQIFRRYTGLTPNRWRTEQYQHNAKKQSTFK